MSFNGTIVATVAANDMEKSKEFYGQKVGLEQTNEDAGGVTYMAGGARLHIYQSSTAGTGQATCFMLEVDDIEATVAEFKDKGITFEHYDLPGGERQGDIHLMGPFKAAWFKDPDGNIIGIDNKM